MILTTIQAYILTCLPSTHWWTSIPANCEPAPKAFIHANSLINWRRTDVLNPTRLWSLQNNIPLWSERWPITLGGQEDMLGHCKTWKALSLVFSANCVPVIVYFNTEDHSSNMSELQKPSNSTSLTLKQASKSQRHPRAALVTWPRSKSTVWLPNITCKAKSNHWLVCMCNLFYARKKCTTCCVTNWMK